MMRRGCTVAFVHFHSYPYTSLASQENVREIAKALTKFHTSVDAGLRLIFDIQKRSARQIFRKGCEWYCIAVS